MKLPIMEIFKVSLYHVMIHKLTWLKLGLVPLILYLVFELITMATWFLMGSTVGILSEETPYVLLFITLPFVVAGACFFINGYRYGLLNEENDKWCQFKLNRRFLRMSLYLLATGFIVFIFMGLLVNISFFGPANADPLSFFIMNIPENILGLFLLFPFSLIFAFVATDHKTPIKAAWPHIKENYFHLLGLFCLICITVIAFLIAIGLFLSLLIFLLSLISTEITSYLILPLILVLIKANSLLISFPLIGVDFSGIFTYVLGTLLGIVNSDLVISFDILLLFLISPLLLIIWALVTKSLSLVIELIQEQ